MAQMKRKRIRQEEELDTQLVTRLSVIELPQNRWRLLEYRRPHLISLRILKSCTKLWEASLNAGRGSEIIPFNTDGALRLMLQLMARIQLPQRAVMAQRVQHLPLNPHPH